MTTSHPLTPIPATVFDDCWVSQSDAYPLEEIEKLIRKHLLYTNHCFSKGLKNFFATLKTEVFCPQPTSASPLPAHTLLPFRMRGWGRFCDDKTSQWPLPCSCPEVQLIPITTSPAAKFVVNTNPE